MSRRKIGNHVPWWGWVLICVLVFFIIGLLYSVNPPDKQSSGQDTPTTTYQSVPLPNSNLTPGIVDASITQADLCPHLDPKRVVRAVTDSTKRKVFAEYHIDYATHSKYEVDHLISLELGGSNDIRNLWPEPYDNAFGAHQKDVLENKLHALVCGGSLSLGEAQSAISRNWYSAYQKYAQ